MANGKIRALRELYRQAFWAYTVIIALAIQQVLVEIIPRSLNYFFSTELQLPTRETLYASSLYIELVRSLVFLIVITRFYLGSVACPCGADADARRTSQRFVGSRPHRLCPFSVVFLVGVYTLCHRRDLAH